MQRGKGGAFHLNMVCVVKQEDERRRLWESVEALDQNRPPLRTIHGYCVLDHLGSGAFGSVFKVLAPVPQWASNLRLFSFPINVSRSSGPKAKRAEPAGPERGQPAQPGVWQRQEVQGLQRGENPL